MTPVPIRLTLEKVEAWYICTALDNVGVVAVHRSTNKELAIRKCKQKVEDSFECDIVYGEIEEMYGK